MARCTRCTVAVVMDVAEHCGACPCCTVGPRRVTSERADQPVSGQLLRPCSLDPLSWLWEDALTGTRVRMELRPSTLPPPEEWPPGFPDALKDAQRRARQQHDARAAHTGGPTAEQVRRMTREYLAAERFGSRVGGNWRPFGPLA